jgi:hypothetical protein
MPATDLPSHIDSANSCVTGVVSFSGFRSAVATQPNNIVLIIRCLLGDQACEQEQSTKNVKSYSDSRNLQWVKVKRACAVVDPSC